VGGLSVCPHPGFGLGTWEVYPHGKFAVSGYFNCLSSAPAEVRPVLEFLKREYPWDQPEVLRLNFGPAGQGGWSLWENKEDFQVSGRFTTRRNC
jgi:hypothetical protein